MYYLSILCSGLFSGIMVASMLAAPLPKSGVVLKNESLSLGFDADRLVLVSLKDPKSGHEFLESLPEVPILWALDMEKLDGTPFRVNSAMECKRQVKRTADGRKVTFLWSGLAAEGEAAAIEVRVTVSLPEGSDRSYWTIEVDNSSKSSLMDVQFPYLSGISKAGQPSAAIPRHNWGNMERAITHTRGSYPSDIWPMQFIAMLEKESGLYLAFEDPKTTLKYFDLKPGDFFTFTNLVENATLPGNDYVSPGPVAIGVCGADWWKAAKMFRRWALKQEWTKRGPLSQASNIPEEAKKIGIWFNEYLGSENPETQISQIKAAQEFYKLPIAMQFYNWHRGAFDTEYPEYFPPRANFDTIVNTLTSTGSLVAPYVNGRLQDTNVPSAKAATPFMVRKKDGKHQIEDYQSGASLAVMCPATEYWQKVMQQTARTLVEDHGVNGIYYDQIAAAEPVMCFDPSHGHPLGGGEHWMQGYRKMLSGVKELRTRKGKPLFVASENNSDCYMDTVDAFLTWTPRHPDEIPLLTAVYGGYTLYFASNAQVEVNDGLTSFAMAVGRDIIWGTQPGWMNIDVTSERGAYLRDVARVRHAGLKFFQFGELLGELKPTSDPGLVKGRWKNILRVENIPYDVSLPSVMSSIWKSPEGTLGLAIINLSGEEKTFSYTLKPANYGLSLPEGGKWKLTHLGADASESLGAVAENELTREEKLKPWEFRLIEVASSDKPKAVTSKKKSKKN